VVEAGHLGHQTLPVHVLHQLSALPRPPIGLPPLDI
jgi:hypothetical protein